MVRIDDIVDTEKNEKKEADRNVIVSKFVFWNRTRVFVLVMVLLYMSLLQMNSLIFNFSVICMADVVEDYHVNNFEGVHWFEISSQKSLVFSAMAVGGLTGLALSMPLIQKLGVRNMLTFCGIFSTLGTIFFPLAVSMNYVSVLVCRFLQGLGVSISFTVIGVIPCIWAPTNKSSSFLAILSCAFQISNVICMPISGFLCDSSLGWRAIYYGFGMATVLMTALFYFFYTDTPTLHGNVSSKELDIINHDKVHKENLKEPVPYKAVFSDVCVLVVWISNTGGNLGLLTLMLYGPTYLREVLHFEVKGTGFASALPFLLSAIFKLLVGQLSDRCDFVSEKVRFVTCGCVARIGLAAGFFFMATTSSRVIAQIAFTLAIAISGLNVMGTIKCLQLHCRQHTHFVTGFIGFFAYIIQFVGPIFVGLLCPDNTLEQWNRMFLIVSIIVFVSSAPFPFLTTAEPADYAKTEEELKEKRMKKELKQICSKK